jgi:hypothetical protein
MLGKRARHEPEQPNLSEYLSRVADSVAGAGDASDASPAREIAPTSKKRTSDDRRARRAAKSLTSDDEEGAT